jgi:hypothetical protein
VSNSNQDEPVWIYKILEIDIKASKMFERVKKVVSIECLRGLAKDRARFV